MRREDDVITNPNNLFKEQMMPLLRNMTLKEIPVDIEIEVIMNHLLLILGIVLNLLIIIVITFNSSMHKSTSCYILSLVLSNLILLLDTLQNVLAWWYNIQMNLDLQFITDVTFKASILTLVMLTIDRYLLICSTNSVSIYNSIGITVPKFKTAAKSVIIIWIMISMATAMELHLYVQFEWEVPYKHNVDPAIQIFVISTFIFLFLPSGLIIFLVSLMAYELEKLRLIGEISKKNVESLQLLGVS